MNGMGLAGVELHGMIGFNVLAKYKIQYDFTSDKLLLTPLKYEPPPVERMGDGRTKGQPGGLEMIGSLMKMLGPLLGFKGPPVRQPRGFLGAELAEDDGVVVKSVLPGGPADKAGLKAGDKIEKIGKTKIDLLSDVVRLTAKLQGGDELPVSVIRGGTTSKPRLRSERGCNMKRIIVTFTAIALVAAQLRADEKPVKVPFELLKSRHMVVNVKVNGKGPYRLIFDTGAPTMLVNNKVAKQAEVLGKDAKKPPIALFGMMGQATLKTLEIGGVKATDVPCMVMDHPTVEAISQHFGPIEGIVGFPFFARYTMTVDYQAKEMTFTPNGYKPADIMQSLMATLMARTTIRTRSRSWCRPPSGVSLSTRVSRTRPRA